MTTPLTDSQKLDQLLATMTRVEQRLNSLETRMADVPRLEAQMSEVHKHLTMLDNEVREMNQKMTAHVNTAHRYAMLIPRSCAAQAMRGPL